MSQPSKKPRLELEPEPVFVVTDEMEREPLTPLGPESRLERVKDPLLLALPTPLATEIAPPVTCMLIPEDIAKYPPEDESPDPILRLKLPPTPDVADLVRTTTEPLLPLDEDPVWTDIAPLLPLDPAS